MANLNECVHTFGSIYMHFLLYGLANQIRTNCGLNNLVSARRLRPIESATKFQRRLGAHSIYIHTLSSVEHTNNTLTHHAHTLVLLPLGVTSLARDQHASYRAYCVCLSVFICGCPEPRTPPQRECIIVRVMTVTHAMPPSSARFAAVAAFAWRQYVYDGARTDEHTCAHTNTRGGSGSF